MSRSDAVSRPRIGTRRAPAWLLNDRLGAALLFAPGFVAYLAFMVLPILLSFYFSFFDWNGISRTMNFVGLRNFARAIQDDSFLNALRITFFFTIPGALAGNALGILFAVLVNRPGPLTNVYRAVFFFPLPISAVAIGFIWKAILSYNGIFNDVFVAMGANPIDWLGSFTLAPWAIILVNLWHDTGFVTVIYLAGLQAVPHDLYDAAQIDGASHHLLPVDAETVRFRPYRRCSQGLMYRN